MQYFTDMRVVFDSLNGKQIDYNWLITNIDLNQYPDESWFDAPYIWIAGKELSELIYNNNIQFIWALFSGFKKDVSFEEISLSTMPSVNIYSDSDYWEGNYTQHPLAEIEIASWDSSYMTLISKDAELAIDFKSYFKEAESFQDRKRK
jgi:hypothetical protein